MPRNSSRLVIALGAALLAGAPALHAQSGQPVRGDVDGDGRVTAADARIVSDFLVGKPIPAGANVRERGDVNGDGRITSLDAAIIARAAAGRDMSRFPVGTPVPAGAMTLVECAADVHARTVSCGAPGMAGDARGNVTVGGQNINVQLISSNLNINTGAGTFTFDVKIKNLLRQAMGADSGSGTPNANGVRVFFHSGPTQTEAAASGSGHTVTVVNPDSAATFTGTNQPYFKYAGALLGTGGVLLPDSTSGARSWTLHFDPGVNKFNFQLYLDTQVQYPQGWIDIYPPPPPARQDSSPTFVPTKTLHVGETAVLTGTVRNRFGRDLGTPVNNWGVTPHGAASLSLPTSDSTITVTADSIGTDTVTATTGARTGRIEIVVVPGAPATMVKHAGDGQSATVGTAVTTPPAVKITDSNGDPVPGVSVTFAPVAGSGSVVGGTTTTNAAGVATVGSWTLGTAARLDSLTASSPGLTDVTFTATATAGPAANMVKSAGDAQSATAGAAVAIAPAVTITDTYGNPVGNVLVVFSVTGGGGSITGDSALTNPSGVAAVGSWTLGTVAGANTLDAASTGLTTVTFSATGTAGALHHFVVEAAAGGNIPDQLSGTPFNVKVTAKDANSNTVTSFTGTVGFTTPTAPPGGGITAGAGPSAAFTAGVLSSHAITIAVVGDYTLAATRTGGAETGTSNAFQVQAAPTAANDGPTANSVPGDPYHTAFNTPFNLPATGLMANDTRGFPLATVTFFGGGDLGGLVTGHAAGSTVAPLPGHADGSLTVNADGSVAFTPYTGFTGLYTFQYRIANVRGTSDAQVTIAVGVRPAANNDSYPTNLLGNVPINTATSSNFKVSTNDAGDARVLALGTATNGTALLNADGTFTFTPNAGYTGAASFTYTVTNGFGTTAPATVSMTVSGIAWFIDKGAAAGDGRFGTPFNDLSTAFAAATKPLANQPIFLYSSGTSYTGGVTLLAGQRLVGQGATGGSFAAVMGVTWPADAGAQPSIGGTSPTVGNGLTLGNGNTLQGFNLGGAGTLSGTGFGTLTVSEVGINTTGQALNLTTGTISGGFTGVTSSGGTNNVALSGVTFSGAVGLGSGTLSGATGSALSVTNGTSATASDVLSYSGSITNATAAAANAAVAVSGGSTRLTLTGNVTQTNAGAVVSVSGGHTGTLTFSTGTVSATNGTGLQFDNADGTYNFGSTPTLSLAGGDAGIDVLNGSGGTFTFPSAAVITNPTLEAVKINASSPTFTYPGRITKTNGSTGITVTSNSGGTISFGSRLKTITSTGANVAVNLATNGTATISSLDSLQITSATGNGYNATGGGTVIVQGANNTINSVGGIALNVSSTTIGGSGFTFRSISANGGSNGIVLSSTGSNGLTVSGDGSTHGSGGTIQNTTGADGASAGNGVYLSSAQNVNLSWMNLSNHGNHAIYGTSVTGFTLHRARITGTNGSSTTTDDGSIGFDNLYGSASITSSYIDGGFEDNVRVVNGLTAATASLNRLTMTSDTLGFTGNSGNDAVLIAGFGTAVVNATVQNSRFTGAPANLIAYAVAQNASGNIVITGNTITNTHPAKLGSDFGIYVSHTSTGALTYQIANNSVNNAGGSGIEVDRLAGGNGSMGGSVTGNTVGTAGVAGSGSAAGAAIFIGMVGSSALGTGAVHTDTVSGNVVRQFGNYGIKVVNRGTGGNYLNVQVKNNNVAEPYNTAVTLFPSSGLRFEMGSASGDDGKSCFDISGNTVTNAGTNGAAEIRLFGRFGSKTGLPGLTGAGANALIQGQNTITTSGTAVNATSTNAFQATCPPT